MLRQNPVRSVRGRNAEAGLLAEIRIKSRLAWPITVPPFDGRINWLRAYEVLAKDRRLTIRAPEQIEFNRVRGGSAPSKWHAGAVLTPHRCALTLSRLANRMMVHKCKRPAWAVPTWAIPIGRIHLSCPPTRRFLRLQVGNCDYIGGSMPGGRDRSSF